MHLHRLCAICTTGIDIAVGRSVFSYTFRPCRDCKTVFSSSTFITSAAGRRYRHVHVLADSETSVGASVGGGRGGIAGRRERFGGGRGVTYRYGGAQASPWKLGFGDDVFIADILITFLKSYRHNFMHRPAVGPRMQGDFRERVWSRNGRWRGELLQAYNVVWLRGTT